MPSGKVPATLLACEIGGLAALAETEGVARVAPLLEQLPELAAESIGRAGGRLLGLDGDRLVFGFGGPVDHPGPGRHSAAAAAYLLRRLTTGPLADYPDLVARAALLGVRGSAARQAALGWNSAATRKLFERALSAAEPGEVLLGSELKGDLPPGLPTPRPRSAGPSRYLAVSAGGGAPPAADGGADVAEALGTALQQWREQLAARERLPIAVCVAQATASGAVGALRQAAAKVAAAAGAAEARDVAGGTAIFVGLQRRTNDALARCLRLAIELRHAAADAAPRAGVVADIVAAAQLAKSPSERKAPLSKPLGKATTLAGKAAPGEIRAATATLADVPGRFRTAPVASGIERVIDVGPSAWRADAAERGEPGGAFVGRRSEMRYAEEGLGELFGGKGARYLVLGGPGAGKSAVLAEWRRVALSKGVRVGFGVSRPSTSRLPYGAFREAVADLFDLPLQYTAEAAAEAVVARYSALGLDPDSPRASAIIALLVGHSAPALVRLSAEIRGRLLQESIREWLEAEASRQPVALMLDDAHHADTASRELLPALAIACKPTPVLWVLCGRTGNGQPVLPEVRRIRVNAMTPTDLRELLRQGLGETPPPPLLKWCAKAGGLPGPAVDHLREIRAGAEPMPRLVAEAPEVEAPPEDVDAGESEGDEAAPPAKAPEPKITLPPPLAHRVASLDDEARAVLHVAAILGPTVHQSALRWAVGRDPSRALATLQSLGILVERALAGGTTWAFTSLYLHEAVARELTEDASRTAHQAVFTALSKAASNGPSLLEDLVVHGRVAGDPSRVDAQVAAGVAAAHEHHLDAAEDHLREALAQLQEGARRRPEVRFHLAQVLGRRGALDEALEHLARALDELPTPRARRIKRVR